MFPFQAQFSGSDANQAQCANHCGLISGSDANYVLLFPAQCANHFGLIVVSGCSVQFPWSCVRIM